MYDINTWKHQHMATHTHTYIPGIDREALRIFPSSLSPPPSLPPRIFVRKLYSPLAKVEFYEQ